MAVKEFDVFVMGTGTAGKSVAVACAKAGKSVAISDNREYGGTCANRGCDPKKVLVGITEVLNNSENLLRNGISSIPKASWEDLMKFKKTFTDPVPYVHEQNLKKEGITLYHQSPQFLDKNALSVEGKTVKAKKIVIATGQKPRVLAFQGNEHALVSDDFLALEKLPRSMLFIGGGYVGMELSHIAARMGVEVTLIHSGERPLAHFDADMVDHLMKASEQLGIKFIFNARVNDIDKLQKQYRVFADQQGKKVSAEAELVINTTGRVPSIADLNLEKGEVSYSKRGITVNEKLQNPKNKDVYACGDVADSPGLALTPLSSYEAQFVVSQLLDKTKKEVHYPPQPSAVFTLPNVAKVGLSEADAKEQGYDFVVKHEKALDWYNAKRTHAKRYAYKTITEKGSGQILGVHLIGPEAAEVINLFTMAINNHLTSDDLKQMIFTYPTWGADIKAMV